MLHNAEGYRDLPEHRGQHICVVEFFNHFRAFRRLRIDVVCELFEESLDFLHNDLVFVLGQLRANENGGLSREICFRGNVMR